MAETARQPTEGFTTRGNQPLIGIATMEGDEEVVRYFNSEEELEAARAKDRARSIQRALDLAGAWAELDVEGGPDPLDELDRMRHESKPTPPFEL
jgi:hypothetical protein